MFWGTWLNIDGAYNPRYLAFEIEAESIAEATEKQAKERGSKVIFQNAAIAILDVKTIKKTKAKHIEDIRRLAITDAPLIPQQGV
ncbi:hypothetical protein [Plesiomonas shigelloides]|uniref:hypothetical protein n=1 Tax=Plesiomonas shigelloides TaxID=703 RepID=UPI00387F0569